jgi:predicted GNAT family N-acyltransferase
MSNFSNRFKMNIHFDVTEYGSVTWLNALKLREDILRKPLGSFFTEEELEVEKDHVHVIGQINGNLVCTAALVPELGKYKMQRVAVLQLVQNQNIGSEMMKFCEEYAQSKQIQIIYCHARSSAVNFYLKNGYFADGEYFMEDGIPHLKMIKKLA